jgi:hypothetical protein
LKNSSRKNRQNFIRVNVSEKDFKFRIDFNKE